MNRWRAYAACWLVALASCASDGGQRGTGITAAEGNVAAVQSSTSTAVGGIDVAVEGTEAQTTTDASGAFSLQGTFAGYAVLRFTRAADGLDARLHVDAPAGGRIDARDVTLDAASGDARATAVGVVFTGRVDVLDCPDDTITLSSVERAADDLHTYDVALASSSLHDADGKALTCADLRVGDRLDVDGTYDTDGAIGDAALTRK
jgi:hypothetical protein